jgi:hypothetical protein
MELQLEAFVLSALPNVKFHLLHPLNVINALRLIYCVSFDKF